jgi:hypothetical protein
MRKAASSPTTESAVPSLEARFFAHERSGHAVGQVFGGRHRRAVDRALDRGRDSGDVVGALGADVHRVHAILTPRELLQLAELHVHVRGLAAEGRLRDPDDGKRLAAELHRVADAQAFTTRVALVQDRLACVSRAEVAAVHDLAGRDGTELLDALMDTGDADRGHVDVVGAATRPRAAELTRIRPLLGHRALDVEGVEREPAGGRIDAVELRDRRDLRRRHAQLRHRDEVVAREPLARVAEVAEAKAAAAVLLLQLPALLLRELREAAARRVTEVDGPGDGHIGSNAGERLENLGLRAVETTRQRRHRHDQPHAQTEPERGQDRPSEPPPQLREHIGRVEHAPQGTNGSLEPAEGGVRRR